ncbi:MAG: cyclic nucleotide-binding domain-containing protein, partial [Acidobacteriota bacterium]|nr:cyclic nucleotide-binding domain-containing protein [Acidobacteriota bacterium]
MHDQSNPTHTQGDNRILAALPREDFARITAHLEPVKLSQGQLLYQTGQHIEDFYFLTNALVSFVSQMSDGMSVEVGVTGSEGMVGIPILLGGDRAPHDIIVQIPGG